MPAPSPPPNTAWQPPCRGPTMSCPRRPNPDPRMTLRIDPAPRPAARATRVAIVGAGAPGLNFAARLAATGPVALIARLQRGPGGRAQGRRAGGRGHSSTRTPSAPAPARRRLGDRAGQDLRHRAAARTALALRPRGVVSLQNGLVDDVLRGCAAACRWGRGITTEGRFATGPGCAAGAGETCCRRASRGRGGRGWEAGIAARVEPQIAAARLAKLLMNVVINPLAAIFRVPNGAVLELPQRPALRRPAGRGLAGAAGRGLASGEPPRRTGDRGGPRHRRQSGQHVAGRAGRPAHRDRGDHRQPAGAGRTPGAELPPPGGGCAGPG